MHASILFLLSITALATTRSAGTYGWTSIGCYVDSGNRLLGPVWVNDNNNNVGDCLVRCRGYKYGMVENARGEIYEKGATAWCLGGAGQQIPAAAELQFTQQE
ncbi:uncharacterized protein LAJ45_04132 [Morchella importuna]|uniref:uncharacterized protein n=1 Tax=Morchella importuna TaxID=1174673 RepID=UPI001E8E145A|nr:uncharacterized protein LAJ45_04132 [Morchella importuna]KAH8151511.1 hypothetical protein LAJ45_04132 [Morchella importuna]